MSASRVRSTRLLLHFSTYDSSARGEHCHHWVSNRFAAFSSCRLWLVREESYYQVPADLSVPATAKHGVLGFGRALIPRLAAAQLSIRVNTLSPSWTDTNLVPCVKNLLSDINVEVQPASAVARCAAYLMADTSRNGQLIYVQHGKYAEVDSILLGKYSEINGRFPSKDDVLRLLEETAVSG
ncbi:hypothetical protein BKA60DRAFT_153089 [Fusarium oxysporum]|nr:hypothetical protein BKA60DRAFT_153089 [Fusarium oxysporum]